MPSRAGMKPHEPRCKNTCWPSWAPRGTWRSFSPRSRVLRLQLPQSNNTGLELLASRGGYWRPSTAAAEVGVGPPVLLSGAVMRYRHQRVEFAAQFAQLAVHGHRGHRRAVIGGRALLQLLVLA